MKFLIPALSCAAPYPVNFIPVGAEMVVGVDTAGGVDTTVRGFYDPATGEYHIQEIVTTPRPSGPFSP